MRKYRLLMLLSVLGGVLVVGSWYFGKNILVSQDSAVQDVFQPPTVTPTPIPTYSVDFVPVTNFHSFRLRDVTQIEESLFVREDYFELVSALPVWEELEISLEAKPTTDYESFLSSPRPEFWLVPLAHVTPQMRVLLVDNVAIWETIGTDWPIVGEFTEPDLAIDPEQIASLIFGGTVVLSRGVAERIEKYQDPFYPWQEIADVLSAADYAFINFKGALTSDCVYSGYTLQFCGAFSYLNGMKKAGVDGVSVSGNHIGDFGVKGMRETIEQLDVQEIDHTGLGMGYTEAIKPIMLEFGKTTVGIVAYNNVFGTAPCAGVDENWSVSCLRDQDNVREVIQDLAEKVDIVIVYPNWGPEYVHQPHRTAQIHWGRLFVDAGADLVIGDQAHWVQTMEFYKETPIFYGVGNLVFDQMWSEETREGLLVKAYIYNGNILHLEPIPTVIYDYAQPRVDDGERGQRILEYLKLPVE